MRPRRPKSTPPSGVRADKAVYLREKLEQQAQHPDDP
jgi:hypothetical protein